MEDARDESHGALVTRECAAGRAVFEESLKEAASECRKKAKRARAAYHPGTFMWGWTHHLADVYECAARVYETKLFEARRDGEVSP